METKASRINERLLDHSSWLQPLILGPQHLGSGMRRVWTRASILGAIRKSVYLINETHLSCYMMVQEPKEALLDSRLHKHVCEEWGVQATQDVLRFYLHSLGLDHYSNATI